MMRPPFRRNHRLRRDDLREREKPAQVYVHELVPRLQRMRLRRGAPSRTRVVHQDVHAAERLEDLLGNRRDRFTLSDIADERFGVHAKLFQTGTRFVEFRLSFGR